MNKGDLIEAVASQLGETKAAAGRAVEAVLASIADGVKEHEKVTLAGFGSFEKKHRKARTGVNPSTKEKITIGPSKTVAFKAAQSLREQL